ncbi:hypothetical protein F0L17_10265 [Streptomyces sp. TRM43335]|uniref:Uncharacterized protein n=1 Tax=Streptomyces taklimakanensis TaxID=2569853 RepID=A0A6G2BC72_9ACTN|nr:hypothetical protein [Streptomyces taklimakanensis]MTE19502.1 hypothetical protein [Streptomyces taklimakanensis]
MSEADGENVFYIAPGAEETTSALESVQQWWSEHFKVVNDSVQGLYASFQAFKTDISLGTFAYDLVKFDESGLTVAGVQVWKPNYIQDLETELNRRWPQLGNEPPVTRAEVEQSVATVRRTAASAQEEARRTSSDLRNMRQRVSEARAPRQEPSRGFMGLGRTRGDIARLRAEIELLRAALG